MPGVEESPLLSDRQRQFFRSDFYGKLIVETREKDTRAYFRNESPDDVAWEGWDILSRVGDTLTIRSSLAGETLVRDVKLHGNCYEVLQPNLGFSEWFCREP